jgi:hypothetical protein
MGVVVMAKAKMVKATKGRAGRKPSGEPRKSIAVTLKGGPEWKEWLEGLAEHCRLDVAKAIDRALIMMAKAEGYDRDAPPR